MRHIFILCFLVVGVLTSGCKTKYYYVDAGVPIGHACPNGDECYGGTFCVEGMCTVNCQTNADCFSGTECRPYGDNNELTCVTVRYKTGPVMVGTSCGVDSTACNPVDPECDPQFNCNQSCTSDAECSPAYRCSPDFNTCMRKLFCYGRVQDDPDAYCTQECVDDRDCPTNYYCETVASETDANRKICVKRVFCSPCLKDSDCNLAGGVCGTDSQGGRFCTTPCVPTTDASDPNFYTCPQPYSECKDSGDGHPVCQHRYGACVGDGSACAPCRSRHDCQQDTGAYCFRNFYSGERFCTVTCSSSCADSAFACFQLNNDCTTALSCLAPNATCDTNTSTCSPANPNQCFLNFDWGCTTNANKPYSNPKYPTCYQDYAGPDCTSG